MIYRYTRWCSIFLLVLVLCMVQISPVVASMRVSVLALPRSKAEIKPSHDMAELVRKVLKPFKGVDLKELSIMDSGLKNRVDKIIHRCGNQSDCQVRIARLMNAQVFVFVQAQSISGGVLVNLSIRDMGTQDTLCRVSRTMTGSIQHQAEVLDGILTGALFPDRMIGRVELKLEPAGGDVYLDGQLKVCSAPGAVNLEAIRSGRHTLLVRHKGYSDFIGIIQVPYNGVSQIDVHMQAEFSCDK